MANPIYHPIHDPGGGGVGDDGARDGEHIRRDAEHETFGFEFDGGGGDGVGKARDGHQCARACVLGDLIIKTEACQQNAQCDQRDGADERGGLLMRAERLGSEHNELPDGADRAADKKGFQAVGEHGRAGGSTFGQTRIFLCGEFRGDHIPLFF